jgi:hypothetical protein
LADARSFGLCELIGRISGSNFFIDPAQKPYPARVSRKWTSQNLDFKELKYQNLENKELSGAGFALGGPSLPRS